MTEQEKNTVFELFEDIAEVDIGIDRAYCLCNTLLRHYLCYSGEYTNSDEAARHSYLRSYDEIQTLTVTIFDVLNKAKEYMNKVQAISSDTVKGTN